MSLITRLLAILFAMLVLGTASQAAAKDMSATAACKNAWAKAWAAEHGKSVADAERYARRIRTDPPTTLTVAGKALVFAPGMTVWGACEKEVGSVPAVAVPVPAVATTPPADERVETVSTAEKGQAFVSADTVADLRDDLERAQTFAAIMTLLAAIMFVAIASMIVALVNQSRHSRGSVGADVSRPKSAFPLEDPRP